MGASCNKLCVSQECKARKACACKCEAWFAGVNPSITQSCIGDCWDSPMHLNRYAKPEDYMCGRLDPQLLYNHHGYLCEGFDPLSQSAQGQAYSEQQKQINSQEALNKKILFFALIVLVALGIYYFIKKGKL
ncbi:MAG: hypothetical protein MK212_17825 [Saprospiraceae bacterium]|nr:hypothetical protein [Saprospiraceae bacterium]